MQRNLTHTPIDKLELHVILMNLVNMPLNIMELVVLYISNTHNIGFKAILGKGSNNFANLISLKFWFMVYMMNLHDELMMEESGCVSQI